MPAAAGTAAATAATKQQRRQNTCDAAFKPQHHALPTSMPSVLKTKPSLNRPAHALSTCKAR
eukprot:5179776-Lingulodinium_polyedra.AAC.1